MLQNRVFFALAPRSGFRAAISDAVARGSIVFCNSVCADRIVMAASRLLGATAACVILVSFAAGHCKSYWSGCIKAAIVICQQIFSILALVIFLLKIPLEKCFKSCFFCFWRRDPVLEVQFLTPLRVVEILVQCMSVGVSHPNTANILWSSCAIHHKLHPTWVYNIENLCTGDSVCYQIFFGIQKN